MNATSRKEIFEAARRGDPLELTKLLLEEKKDPNFFFPVYLSPLSYLDPTQETPLHAAASKGHLLAVEVLLKAGARPNLPDKLGKTALQRWLIGENSPEEKLKDSSLGEETLQKGLDLLLRYQADPSLRSPFGGRLDWPHNNALETAIYHRYSPQIVESLLNEGIDVNERDEKGETSLSKAICWGHFEAALFLLQAGADPLVAYPKRSRYSDSILHATLKTALIEGAPDFEKQSQARLEVIRFLLQKGIDPNARDVSKDSSLHLVLKKLCPKEMKDAIDLLLAFGAKIDSTNLLGQTPLHYAVKRASPSIVRHLLSQGASVHAKDVGGNTPLHSASYVSLQPPPFLVENVELLFEYGVDETMKNGNGGTALEIFEHAPADIAERVKTIYWNQFKKRIKDTQVLIPDLLPIVVDYAKEPSP